MSNPLTEGRELRPRTVSALLQIAAWQVGVLESPAGSNRVKYAEEYGLNGQPWCLMFVWWVFREAGFNLFRTASCTAFVRQYRTKAPGQIVQANYKPGDIVFFDFSGKRAKTEHVGIVESVEANGVLVTIEGNTGTGNDTNGGAPMRRRRGPKRPTPPPPAPQGRPVRLGGKAP